MPNEQAVTVDTIKKYCRMFSLFDSAVSFLALISFLFSFGRYYQWIMVSLESSWVESIIRHENYKWFKMRSQPTLVIIVIIKFTIATKGSITIRGLNLIIT